MPHAVIHEPSVERASSVEVPETTVAGPGMLDEQVHNSCAVDDRTLARGRRPGHRLDVAAWPLGAWYVLASRKVDLYHEAVTSQICEQTEREVK